MWINSKTGFEFFSCGSDGRVSLVFHICDGGGLMVIFTNESAGDLVG